MATTPSNRLRLTPSNSPFLPRPGRSPLRARPGPDSRLTLKRVVGTTCTSTTGFDAAKSSFAYIAGGAVVVVDVVGDECKQRFFRARPTAVPIYSTPAVSHSSSTPSTPKANDSRNRVSLRDSTYGQVDWAESPSANRTWTSRERIKAATCVALNKDGRFLAVGETGYAPRVLIFGLDEASSDTPLVSISEHTYGVNAVAWSPDSRYLASLGSANDGFLYVWRIDPRTGAAKLFQQNRCTSFIRGMVWMGTNLITLGVRHIKVWRIEEPRSLSPVKQKLIGDMSNSPMQPQKTLPGRNVLLGNMIEATFACAAAIDDTRAVICSETGDVCLFDDAGKQMKLTKVLESGFVTTCVAIRDGLICIGGKSGEFATLDLAAFLVCDPRCIRTNSDSEAGLVALDFVNDKLVTLDTNSGTQIRSTQDLSKPLSNQQIQGAPIEGRAEAFSGVDVLPPSNKANASFFSWSGSGQVILWDLDGSVKSSFQVPLEQPYEGDGSPFNQLTIVRATRNGGYFVAGDKLGILNIVDAATKECVLTLKLHSSDCQSITTFEDDSNLLIASCGRDRTTQLLQKTTGGVFEHFQTLEFPAKVAQVLIPSHDKVITCSSDRSLQVHDLITKEGEPDVKAAIAAKTLHLKASPASMTMGTDGKSVFVSLLDRSICMYDLDSGKLCNTFKCTDENGMESVVIDSLVARPATETEPAFLLGVSNTDKSIRIYDAQTGSFLDREWGHTEGINGVTLVEKDNSRRVVSVGSDGTIMIWELDLQDRFFGSSNRSPSPEKDPSALGRGPPLRRVLSKAELAEFQRPSTAGGRRSPPRSLSKRKSLYNLQTAGPARTPISALQSSPSSAIAEDTPSRKPTRDDRRPSRDDRSRSPPASPKSRITRRPSLPVLDRSKTRSNPNLRGFGSLSMATEQASRTLRAYRKKLSSTDPISQDVLSELDQELRMTAIALGDRATRTQAMSDSMLNGLLDQYSERLVTLLDEKLKLTHGSPTEEPSSPEKRPGSSGTGTSHSST